jgi:hypothetical protein
MFLRRFSTIDAPHMMKKSPSVLDPDLAPQKGDYGTPESSESPLTSSSPSSEEVKGALPAIPSKKRRPAGTKKKPTAVGSKIKEAAVIRRKQNEQD